MTANGRASLEGALLAPDGLDHTDAETMVEDMLQEAMLALRRQRDQRGAAKGRHGPNRRGRD